MKSFGATLALAGAASAAAIQSRAAPVAECCFGIDVKGAVSGSVGQFSDGQNRVGSGYGGAQFCYYPSTTSIVDESGRGCIATGPTTQYQCDAGLTASTATSGITLASNGSIEHNGSAVWYECNSGSGYNLYTMNPGSAATGCSEVTLEVSGGNCTLAPSSSAPASSAPATSAPASTSVKTSVVVSTSTKPASTVESATTETEKSTATVATPTTETVAKPTTIVSATTQVMTTTQEMTETVASPTTLVSVSKSVSVESCVPSTITETITAPAPPAVTVTAPAPPAATVTVTAPCSSAPIATPPAVSSPVASPPAPSSPAGSASVPPVSLPSPISPSAGSQTTPAPSAPATTYACNPAHSYPGGVSCISSGTGLTLVTPSAGASTSTQTLQSTLTVTQPGASSTQSAPAPSMPSATAPAATACSTPNVNGQYGCPEQCPLVLPADFQYPHLIEVNGVNGYFPAANATEKTDFTFDIPASYAGKTCTASFALPEKSMLVTSDYTLTSPAGGEVSFSMGGKPVASFTPMAGKSVVVSSGPCAAGQAISYEMTATGGVDLRYFQDYNACAIGLFVVPS